MQTLGNLRTQSSNDFWSNLTGREAREEHKEAAVHLLED
jgi:hypothetical protein